MPDKDGKTENEILSALVYDQLKAWVLTYRFPPGSRLQAHRLVNEFKDYKVSVTPIRQALILLSKERLITEVPNAGFFVKELSESEIATQFEIQHMFLDKSLSSIDQTAKAPGILKPPDLTSDKTDLTQISAETAVRMMNDLFNHIARQSGKTDFVDAVGNAGDRTHFIRTKDYEFFGDPDNLLVRLCQLYYRKDFDTLRRDLSQYFQLKTERLPQVFRLLRGATLKAS